MFLEIEFPRKLAMGAVGGPMYSTQINSGFSGYEQRNQNWAQSRAAWTVNFENKPQSEYQNLLAFFHAARGMANSFRLYDMADNAVVGQAIGVGDGTTASFQLIKTYVFSLVANEITRPVQKPITSRVKDFYGNALTDTVNVYVNAGLQGHNAGYVAGGGAAYTLDETTGIITFQSGHIPTGGQIITADFGFHWPVRFDLDQLSTQFLTPGNGVPGGPLVTVAGMKLAEVRIQLGQSS